MKLSKFTVIIAVLLMAILAIGAVSAESIGDADASLTSDSDLTLQSSDDSAKDVSAVDTVVSTDNAVENNLGDTAHYYLYEYNNKTYSIIFFLGENPGNIEEVFMNNVRFE